MGERACQQIFTTSGPPGSPTPIAGSMKRCSPPTGGRPILPTMKSWRSSCSSILPVSRRGEARVRRRTIQPRPRPRCLRPRRSASCRSTSPILSDRVRPTTNAREKMHQSNPPVADLDPEARHLGQNVIAELRDAFYQRTDHLVRFLAVIDGHQVIHALAMPLSQ